MFTTAPSTHNTPVNSPVAGRRGAYIQMIEYVLSTTPHGGDQVGTDLMVTVPNHTKGANAGKPYTTGHLLDVVKNAIDRYAKASKKDLSKIKTFSTEDGSVWIRHIA